MREYAGSAQGLRGIGYSVEFHTGTESHPVYGDMPTNLVHCGPFDSATEAINHAVANANGRYWVVNDNQYDIVSSGPH